jgi:hypothetical protein
MIAGIPNPTKRSHHPVVGAKSAGFPAMKENSKRVSIATSIEPIDSNGKVRNSANNLIHSIVACHSSVVLRHSSLF